MHVYFTGILGNSAEVYVFGTQYMWYLLAMVSGTAIGTMLFVPLYYPLKITSIFEVRINLADRFYMIICPLLIQY